MAPVVVVSDDDSGPGPQVTQPPAGIVIGVGMVLWGIERFFDEHLWLGEDGHLGSLLVQGAGIALAVAGAILLITRIGPLQRWRRGEGGDPAPRPVVDSGSAEDRPDVDPTDPTESPTGPPPGPEPEADGRPQADGSVRVSSATGGPSPTGGD
jgi:hypothetical protein